MKLCFKMYRFVQKLSIIFFFIFCSFFVTAKECRTPADWQEYFLERLDVLDPIEGIFDIQIKISASGVDYETIDGSYAIARIFGNCFSVYRLDGEECGYYITKVGNTSYYYMNNYYNTSVTTSRFGLFYTYYKTTPYTKLIRNRFRLENEGFIFEYNASRPEVGCNFWIQYLGMAAVKVFPDEFSVTGRVSGTAWSGTCFALGNGFLATNDHVAGQAKHIRVFEDETGNAYDAKLVATDKINDLSILKVSETEFSGAGAVPYILNSGMADVATHCFVLGYPKPGILGRQIKYTEGTVSAWTGFQDNPSTYQISAPTTGGNSGGPTFNDQGDVIGILNSGVPSVDNVSYAIKVSYLISLIRANSLDFLLGEQKKESVESNTELFRKLKKYVYYVECTTNDSWEDGVVSRVGGAYFYELPKPVTKQDTSENDLTEEEKSKKRLEQFRVSLHSDIKLSSSDKFWNNEFVFRLVVAPYIEVETNHKGDWDNHLNAFVAGWNEAKVKTPIGKIKNESVNDVDYYAILDLLALDDDGESYCIASFYHKDELLGEIYVSADGGKGDNSYVCSLPAFRNIGKKLAKKIDKLGK